MKRSRSQSLKKEIQLILNQNPEAKLVKNRLKLLRVVLTRFYPIITSSVGKDTMEMFLREVLFVDRAIRLATEGQEKEIKEVLSQEFIIKEIM